jgi:VWFA-related protein
MRHGPGLGRRGALCLLTCAVTALSWGLAAQGLRDPRPPWKVGTEVVWAFATVSDQNGQPVPDLPRDAFRIFDDGVEQEITQFSGDRVPVSLGLVVDISESMRGTRIVHARASLSRFLVELLDPGDEAFLLAFNHTPRLAASWAMPPASLAGMLDQVIPSGGTALYDALARAARELDGRRHQRAALVVVSDGADTASDKALFDVRREVRRSDAFVYALAIRGAEDRPSTQVNPEALRAVTDETGGYTAVVEDSTQLALETARIAQELNHQYLLGYAAPRVADGKFHSIRVRLKENGYYVRSRRGYIATRDDR